MANGERRQKLYMKVLTLPNISNCNKSEKFMLRIILPLLTKYFEKAFNKNGIFW